MQNDLISRSALREKLVNLEPHGYVGSFAGQAMLRELAAAPAIDAVPVVHAYWMDDTYCSNCRAAKARPWAGYLEQNSNTFCHVCGAKMDGGAC